MPARLIGRAGMKSALKAFTMKASPPFGSHRCLLARLWECVCLRRPTGEKEVGLFVSGCFPHLCLPLVTVWNKTGCLANWTKTLAYLYAGIKRQKASGRKQNIITGMCPKWMLHQGCNGTSVTLQVNSCADNHSVVWRWVLCESFGSQQRSEPPSGSVTENTFGRSTNENWKSSHCNYTHAYLHTIQISFYFNTLNERGNSYFL